MLRNLGTTVEIRSIYMTIWCWSSWDVCTPRYAKRKLSGPRKSPHSSIHPLTPTITDVFSPPPASSLLIPTSHPQSILHCIMAEATGAQIIARSLRDLGITTIFGIVGIPVVEIAEEAINLGIRFVAFRNEQACSYAASVYGYMTGRPGVCLVVGGPGVLHAMAGVRPNSQNHRL